MEIWDFIRMNTLLENCGELAEEGVTAEQRFMGAAAGGRNCFLTGMAGTGKSTMLRRFIAEGSGVGPGRGGVSSQFSDPDPLQKIVVLTPPRKVDVTAPTGVAALNVGGMTIHRFCGMLLGPQAGQSNEEYFAFLERDPRRSILAGFNRVRRCEVLVIDEISMLPGRRSEEASCRERV